MPLYDRPDIYDLVFDEGSAGQVEFLIGCFQRHARRLVGRVLEPGCGSGRLLRRLAAAGYEVVGIDASPAAVGICNERLVRSGAPPAAREGDMASFALDRPADAACCLINTFRHLLDEDSARSHLESVRAALAPGGIYVLGLHVFPDGPRRCREEVENRRIDGRHVRSVIRSKAVDREARIERVAVKVEVTSRAERVVLDDEIRFRIYTWPQLSALFEEVGGLTVAATYSFDHDLDRPIEVGRATEDVVVVLLRDP